MWSRVPLADLLTMERESVRVDPSLAYENFGLYSYARGAFPKPPITGSTTSATTLYRVRAGQFIYSRLFAFEGAFALVPPEMDGWFVSNEYPTFDIDEERIRSDFVALTIFRPAAWRGLAAMTVGMGHRRQRLQPDAFLAYEISLPPLDEQDAIIDAARTLQRGLSAARTTEAAASRFIHALREDRLVDCGDWRTEPGWTLVTLADVADVALGFTKGRKLTGPTQKLPYLRAVNVQDGFISLDDVASIEASAADVEKFSLTAGDVMLLEGCGNPRLVGRGWLWDGSIEPCLHQNSTLRARVKDAEQVLPKFLAHAICASPARRHCVESMEQMSVAHLGLAGARGIPVPVPPMSFQKELVADLESAYSVMKRAQDKATAYEATTAEVVEGLLSRRLVA
jgi:type I restriction enzyme, S subunit